MKHPAISFIAPAEGFRYAPGDVLAVEYDVEPRYALSWHSLEVSVIWCTEGKGDEDLGVHYFQRYEKDAFSSIDLRKRQRFEVTLPLAPLSYDGVIVKIHWCVRARLFLSRGKEVVADANFQLGRVPSAAPVTR